MKTTVFPSVAGIWTSKSSYDVTAVAAFVAGSRRQRFATPFEARSVTKRRPPPAHIG